jgi:D-lactate dehydrogenase
MKTIFFETNKDDEIFYKEQFPSATFHQHKLSSENINDAIDAEIISVFINSEIKQEIIDLLPNLKYVVTRSTGYDHIDVSYAKEKGICVSNVPSYGSVTVAEFTIGLILDISRNISEASAGVKFNNNFKLAGLRGSDLNGKTLGVIGTGKIGRNVIKMAQGFSMNVIAYDPYPDPEYANANHFSYVSFDEVLSTSDIITLHTPYKKENHHLINKDCVLKMKKGVFIVNTARGELIDTDALIFGIDNGIIERAGLDVLEGERDLKEETEIINNQNKDTDYKTLVEDHILIKNPKVTVTPHLAFYSEEAEKEIINTTIKNIQELINGNKLNSIN